MFSRDRAAPRRGTIGGETFALLLRASPVQWIAPHLRARLAVAIVTVAAVMFPIVIRNDANIDAVVDTRPFQPDPGGKFSFDPFSDPGQML